MLLHVLYALTTHTCTRIHVCVSLYIEVHAARFEHESFTLKLNPTPFKYKIYSVEVDLHCLK